MIDMVNVIIFIVVIVIVIATIKYNNSTAIYKAQ